jgi:hypothetical protein
MFLEDEILSFTFAIVTVELFLLRKSLFCRTVKKILALFAISHTVKSHSERAIYANRVSDCFWIF